MGSPRPGEIHINAQVNASAGFRRGLRSFIGSDLVLTIDMPLVAGPNFRQFTGVLAHEFGHFTQGVGMRLTYLVESLSGWLQRITYEQDAWDQKLQELSEEPGHVTIGLVVCITRLIVFLTRLVLWLFAQAGSAASLFLLRQMEYDADCRSAQIVGSEALPGMMERVHQLGAGDQLAMSLLNHTWKHLRQLPETCRR